MTALVLVEKQCKECGVVKPASEFTPHKGSKDGLYTYCKPCNNEKIKARNATRRAEIGEEAWLAERRLAVRRHRERTGAQRDLLQKRAYAVAAARLREAHPEEWEALYRVARYEVGL